MEKNKEKKYIINNLKTIFNIVVTSILAIIVLAQIMKSTVGESSISDFITITDNYISKNDENNNMYIDDINFFYENNKVIENINHKLSLLTITSKTSEL